MRVFCECVGEGSPRLCASKFGCPQNPLIAKCAVSGAPGRRRLRGEWDGAWTGGIEDFNTLGISSVRLGNDSHSDVFVPEGGSGTNEFLHQPDAFGVLQNLDGDAAGAKKILLA